MVACWGSGKDCCQKNLGSKNVMNLFKKCPVKPDTEKEKDWLYVGALTGIFMFLSALFPTLVVLGFLRDITPLSVWWFAGFAGLLVWCGVFWVAGKFLTNFFVNVAFLFLNTEKKKEAKKAKQLCPDSKL